jgi:uncharacterized repeat protein (TIGR03806 family)
MRSMQRWGAVAALVGAAVLGGCASKAPGSGGTGGNDGAVSDTAMGDHTSGGEPEAAAGVDAAESRADAATDVSSDRPQDGAGDLPAGGCVAPTTRGQCTVPANIYCPVPKLSLTGCMDATNPTLLASNVIPYEVNSPLWSDSAYKSRGFVLPAGGTIHVKDCTANPSECAKGPADTGKWVLPVGSVMVKSFMFGDKLVETRLLVHTDAYNWYGYSYQWNEAQTEATIVPDARVEVMFNTGTDGGVDAAGVDGGVVDWHYPSRTDCGDCHTQKAGGTLGPETNQMNRVVGGVNQIDHFQALGLFDAPVPKPYQTALVTPYAGQLGSPPPGATLDQRARSYLHANCAHCHRPDADFNAFDLRYDVSLQDTMACDAPLTMDIGVPDAVVIAPGEPMKSAIWLRMNAPIGAYSSLHMPRIATFQFDTQGLQLISDWITSLEACP